MIRNNAIAEINLVVKEAKKKLIKDRYTFPCYYKENSSGIVVYFEKEGSAGDYSPRGIVVEGTSCLQKTLGFTWRCWSTFTNPNRWTEVTPCYIARENN